VTRGGSLLLAEREREEGHFNRGARESLIKASVKITNGSCDIANPTLREAGEEEKRGENTEIITFAHVREEPGQPESVNLFNALCISFVFKWPRGTKGAGTGAPEVNGHYEFRLQGAIITRKYFRP